MFWYPDGIRANVRYTDSPLPVVLIRPVRRCQACCHIDDLGLERTEDAGYSNPLDGLDHLVEARPRRPPPGADVKGSTTSMSANRRSPASRLWIRLTPCCLIRVTR